MKTNPAFHDFYQGNFGEQWSQLWDSLRVPTRKVVDPFTKYELDLASFWVALNIQLIDGHSFLDMCSAPGGKALVALARATNIQCHLNELSSSRLKRLKAVMYDHLPEGRVNEFKFSSKDGSKLGAYLANSFDRILVDAPCSGERHLLAKPSELEKWTLNRTKGLKKRQYALMCSALQCLKVGGEVVYSTCTLSPIENDDVIERLLKRKGEQFGLELLPPQSFLVEGLGLQINVVNTKHGVLILPHLNDGAGPMFYCRLKRTL